MGRVVLINGDVSNRGSTKDKLGKWRNGNMICEMGIGRHCRVEEVTEQERCREIVE